MMGLHKIIILVLASISFSSCSLTEEEEQELRTSVVLNQLVLQGQLELLKESYKATNANQEILQEELRLLKLALLTKQEAACPYPYVQVLDECFYLSNSKLKWSQAKEYCEGMEGSLAMPKRPFALKSYILEHNAGDPWFHLGATDSEQEDVWNYFDGRPVPRDAFPGSQPDNYGGKEHCLCLARTYHPTLNDCICESKLFFVCQYMGHD